MQQSKIQAKNSNYQQSNDPEQDDEEEKIPEFVLKKRTTETKIKDPPPIEIEEPPVIVPEPPKISPKKEPVYAFTKQEPEEQN